MSRGKSKKRAPRIEKVEETPTGARYRLTVEAPSKKQLDDAAGRIVRAVQAAHCDAANRKLAGLPTAICPCGAVARPDGQMECRGLPSVEEVAGILSGKALRGDAAPIR